MGRLETRIKQLALESGAALVGIGSRRRLRDAPASADPAYLLPATQSLISFGIPFSREVLDDFFAKVDWRRYSLHKKQITRRLYEIGDRLAGFLRGQGHQALAVDFNDYRPEPGAAEYAEMVAMVPDFAHRYGALAAGLGRLGWSGNLLTPRYGAALLLGTVLTSAKLAADPLVEENPCDGCKMCVAACPVGMMHPQQSTPVTVAGITEQIARKRTNNCCWLGCDGYHGLSADGRWSNWSPYRLGVPFPEHDAEIDRLCTRLRKADPDADPDALNLYSNYRGAVFAPDYLFYAVCGNCANLCTPARADRRAALRRLTGSGVVVLMPDGRRAAANPGCDIVEIATPLGLKTAMHRDDYQAALRGQADIRPEAAATLKDRAVLERLGRQAAARS